MAGIIGGIIGGLGGVIQSKIEGNTQNRNVDKTILANRKMAEYQYSKDLEMWNRANEYNSPASQMARYQSAGLNPNLIYGSGSASAGNTATALPKYQAPTADYNYRPGVNIPQMLSMFQDMQLKQAHVDNVKSQTESTNAGTIIKLLEAAWKRDRNEWLVGGPLGYWNNKMVQETNKTSLGKYQNDLFRATLEAKVKAMEIQNKLNESRWSGQNLTNILSGKKIDWFVPNQYINAISRALGSLGVAGIGSAIFKKQPVIINR